METNKQSSNLELKCQQTNHIMRTKVLLLFGLLYSIIYVITDITASMMWESYSYTSQGVSELSAIGSPTRTFILVFFTICNLLMVAFGIGVWKTDIRNKKLRLTGILLFGFGIAGLVTIYFFPVSLRGEALTLRDIMHIIITMIGVVSILLSIVLGAMSLSKQFRLYSIVTILILMVCAVLGFSYAPLIDANQPTPGLGIIERINIYGTLLWISILSIVLFQKLSTQNSIKINMKK